MELYYKIGDKDFVKAKCFTYNFIKYLLFYFSDNHSGYFLSKEDGYTTAYNDSTSLTAPAGNIERGIVVGKSNISSNYLDYRLIEQIAHGNGVNKLEYGGCAVNNLADSGTYYFTRVERSFANTSGGAIEIKEIGIYNKDSICLVRDVLPEAESIPDSKTMNVIYEIRVAY